MEQEKVVLLPAVRRPTMPQRRPRIKSPTELHEEGGRWIGRVLPALVVFGIAIVCTGAGFAINKYREASECTLCGNSHVHVTLTPSTH